MSKIVELLGLVDIAYGGALARDRFHRTFVNRIGSQPQVAAEHGVVVIQRERAQIVARSAASAAREVGVVELIVTHAHMHFGYAEMFVHARYQRTQTGRDGELIGLIHHVFHEVRGFQIRQIQLHRTVHLFPHGLHQRIGRRRLCAQHRYGRGHRGAGQQESFHLATPLPSILLGSGSNGGRSFDLAFFSISISETRMAGDTAETGT